MANKKKSKIKKKKFKHSFLFLQSLHI